LENFLQDGRREPDRLCPFQGFEKERYFDQIVTA
jgi:hypothetical protein